VQISSERTGIYGDVLVTRDDVEKTKPHPEHLHSALKLLGVPAEQAIMVGDHFMDVMAGKAAGTRTVGFLREGRPADLFDKVQPDFIIRSLDELIHALESKQ
jgi:phosphoglycolate phosphatase-like HAD superfamily hydrolase